MMRFISVCFILFMSSQAFSQDEKINVISREVEGEVRTFEGDTLYGTIKIREAQDQYVTTIFFTENGHKKRILSAYDIKKFRQVVPFPDRPTFGVDEVYYESLPSPENKNKKVFMPITEWK